MLLLLLPLVAAIFICERHNLLYPPQNVLYDSLYVHTFVLTSESKPTAKCNRFEAQTYGGKIYLYVLRDTTNTISPPQKGDTLIAKTRIRRPDSIGTFDYRKYLLRQGIVGTAFVSRYELKTSATVNKTPLQHLLYQRLAEAGLKNDELATTGALTLGYKDDLDPELKHRFQASGAAHILAVSGLHTGLLYGILLWLLTLGGRCKPRYENHVARRLISLIIIAVMGFYAWLTGLTPSVVRAVLMVTIAEIGRMAYRRPFSLNTIAAAAFIILIVRPLDLFSVSFQLSFAATTAIVIVARKAEHYIHSREWDFTKKGRIVSWIAGTIIISIAAQIGTLPLTMFYFGQMSNYFLLTNLIVLPLAAFLVPCGLVTIALGGTFIGTITGKITSLFAWTMNHAVGWIEALPGSTTQVQIDLPMLLIYYVILLFLMFFLHMSKKSSNFAR